MTKQHREWCERAYALLSSQTPDLTMEQIQNPDPDKEEDAAMLYILMALLTPPEIQTSAVQRKAVKLAENLADMILRGFRSELAGYVYGDVPGNFPQTFWFICHLAGVELTLRRMLKEGAEQ